MRSPRETDTARPDCALTLAHSDVQAAYLAALNFAFAKVTSTEEALQSVGQ